jgi:hypothetical protein
MKGWVKDFPIIEREKVKAKNEIGRKQSRWGTTQTTLPHKSIWRT